MITLLVFSGSAPIIEPTKDFEPHAQFDPGAHLRIGARGARWGALGEQAHALNGSERSSSDLNDLALTCRSVRCEPRPR
jgi:hypothetical protein